MFGCRHKLQELERSFSSVNPNKLKINPLEQEKDELKNLVQIVLLGATTVVLRCTKCGDYIHRVIPGNLTQGDLRWQK